ncbi:MAG: DUF1801 domain-containing protein [Pseudomonadota bacterium]
MSANKTQATRIDPVEFLSGVEPAQRRSDGLVLLEMFNGITDLKPKMWGPSMVGYGRYRYQYESGRKGEYFLTGFSPRRQNLSVHIMPGYQWGNMQANLSKLGKHKLGKSCLYINKLSDIDMAVLANIVREGLDYMYTHYHTSAE